MKEILSTIQSSIFYCFPCCTPLPPGEVENTELQAFPQDTIICQLPTIAESINCPEEQFSIRSDSTSPIPDSLDVLWRNIPHITSLPKKTERFRQTVTLLDEFNVTYEVVKKTFEGLSQYSRHWSEVMGYYSRIRSFVNEDSDKYFRYVARSDVAYDADYNDVKFAVDSFIREWERLQELLADEEGEAERMIRLMTSDEYEEAVPRGFL